MNTRSDFCSFLIYEDLDKRTEEPLPILSKSVCMHCLNLI